MQPLEFFFPHSSYPPNSKKQDTCKPGEQTGCNPTCRIPDGGTHLLIYFHSAKEIAGHPHRNFLDWPYLKTDVEKYLGN